MSQETDAPTLPATGLPAGARGGRRRAAPRGRHRAAPARVLTAAPVAINARAAARREIGGVERWTRELSRLLPELRPDRYTAIRPPAALAHRAGHAWEQLALPARREAGRAPALARQPRPARRPPQRGRDPRQRAVSRAVLVQTRRTAPGTAGARAAHRAPGAARDRALGARARRARRAVRAGRPTRVAAIAPGVDPAFAAAGDPAPLLRRLGLDRPYVLAVGTDGPRKNLALLDRIAPELAEHGLDVVIAGSTRPYLPRSAAGRRAAARLRPRRGPSRALRGRRRVRDALALRGLRAALRRGDGRRNAGRGRRPRGAARGLRRRRSARRPATTPTRFAAALLRAAGPERERLVAAGRERAARSAGGARPRRSTARSSRCWLLADARDRLRAALVAARRSAGRRPAPAAARSCRSSNRWSPA